MNMKEEKENPKEDLHLNDSIETVFEGKYGVICFCLCCIVVIIILAVLFL